MSLEEENDRLRRALAAEKHARQRAEAAVAVEAVRARDCEQRAWEACNRLSEARRRIAQLEEQASCRERVEGWLRAAEQEAEAEVGRGGDCGCGGDCVWHGAGAAVSPGGPARQRLSPPPPPPQPRSGDGSPGPDAPPRCGQGGASASFHGGGAVTGDWPPEELGCWSAGLCDARGGGGGGWGGELGGSPVACHLRGFEHLFLTGAATGVDALLREVDELERLRGGSCCGSQYGSTRDGGAAAAAGAEAATAAAPAPAVPWRHTEGGALAGQHWATPAAATGAGTTGVAPVVAVAVAHIQTSAWPTPSGAGSLPRAWPPSPPPGYGRQPLDQAAAEEGRQRLALSLPASAQRPGRPRHLGASLEAAAAWQAAAAAGAAAEQPYPDGCGWGDTRLLRRHTHPVRIPGLRPKRHMWAAAANDLAAAAASVAVSTPQSGSRGGDAGGVAARDQYRGPYGSAGGCGFPLGGPAHGGGGGDDSRNDEGSAGSVCGQGPGADGRGTEAAGSPAGWCSIPLGSPARPAR